MPIEQITYQAADRVATITLHRPDKLNAWTQKMEEEVAAREFAQQRRTNRCASLF